MEKRKCGSGQGKRHYERTGSAVQYPVASSCQILLTRRGWHLAVSGLQLRWLEGGPTVAVEGK